MPNTKSAVKRLRQNKVRCLQNRHTKTVFRSQIRKFRELVEAGNVDQAAIELRLAQKKLDQAAAKNVLHPNTVARTKSRLVKLLKKAQSEAAAAS